MTKDVRISHSTRLLLGVFAALSFSVPTSAKTIMWLGNFFQPNSFQNGDLGGVDSVWVPRVDTANNNGYAYGANFKLTKVPAAYVDTTQTHSAFVNWWAVPTWNPNSYRDSRFRLTISYKKFNGPTATPKYQNDRNETQEMNGKYTALPNVIDSACLDQIPGDTAWMYWGLGQTANAQAKPICSDHNPYLKVVGTIHLLNPWPGRTAYVQFDGKWLPLYTEPGRPGWVSTSFYALPNATVSQKLVFANADPSTGTDLQYMDKAGIGATSNSNPFDLSAAPVGWERWIAPAVDGTNAPKVLSTAPALSRTLMIRLPQWNASALRVGWKGVPGKFIAQSTAYCDWYAISFYAGLIPTDIVLVHPYQDTVYGSLGLQKAPVDYSSFTNWIGVNASGTDTLWLNTNGTPSVLPVKPTNASDIKICKEKLLAFQYFDFKLRGTYFPFAEKTNSDVNKGMAAINLGADGLPVYTGKSICGTNYTTKGDPNCVNPANGPNNWFKSSPNNTTGCFQQPLTLNTATGQYEYSRLDGMYFPLDTLVKDPAFNEKLAGTLPHDFGFCMHAKSTFEYVPGLVFKFSGDDDVWVFINKKLALDIGGQHGAVSGEINLDKLNLDEGKAYQFDMFYCERHTEYSNIKIQTTMNLVPSYDFRFDSSVVSGNNVKIDLSYIKTEIDGSKCQDASTQTPVPGKGYFFMQYPDGHSEAIVAPPGASQFDGIVISSDLTSVQIDLEKVKKNPQMRSRGNYKIVIRFQNDPSQANVKEIPFDVTSGAVNLSADLSDQDGDGKADSLVLHSVEATFPGSELKNTGIAWSNTNGGRDSVVINGKPTSVVVGDSVASFDWTASSSPFQQSSVCPAGGCANSGLALTIATSTTDSNFNPIKVLREHIAPFADSARLSFGDGAAPDTLRIWIREGAVKNPNALPSDVWAKVGQASSPRDVSVQDYAILTNGRELRFILPAGHGVGASDQVRVAGLVSDSNMNAATNSSVWVAIRSNPAGTSALYDADGDGMADSLHVAVRGTLAGVKTVKIDWIDLSGDPISKTWAVSGTVSSTFSVLAGSQAFPKGATSCPGGNCTVTFYDATGKVMGVAPVKDSVAPAALAGHYSFGAAFDTLGVKFSEPVNSVSDLPTWVEWGMADKLAGQVAHKSMRLVGQDSGYFVLDTSEGIRTTVYESIRLASGSQAGRLTDLGGTKVGTSSPWAPLTIGLRPFTLRIQKFPETGVLVNTSKNETGVWPPPPATVPAVEVLFADAKNGKFLENDEFGKLTLPDGSARKNDLDKILAVRVLLNRPLDGQLIIYDNMGIHVAMADLSKMREAWLADSTKKDEMREVWLTWNGTDGKGKFAASGVYLFRAVVKVDNGDGTTNFQNLVWKLGWHRDVK